MKLSKKIISAVCALGMIATMTSSMLVAQAADVPTLELNVAWTDEEAGTGTITAVLTDMQLPENTTGMEYAHLSAWQMFVGVDSNVFDTSLYSNAINTRRNQTPLTVSTIGSLTRGNYLPDTSDMRPNWVSGEDWVALLDVDEKYVNPANIGDETELLSINFTLNKENLPTTITLDGVEVESTARDGEGTLIDTIAFGNAAPSDKEMNIVANCTIPGLSIVIPENDGTTASDDTLVSLSPEDIGGEGTVWTDDSGNGEAAVASVANFTSNNAGSVTWSITATPAEGEAVTKSHAFDIPAVEGQMTLGLIVGYDTAEWNSVAITGGAIE